MRELHVVTLSEDGRHVLLAGKRGAATAGFRVALDERLLAAVRGDLPRPGEDPHAAPDLSPKEIQARLRTGESVESIAHSAGVPVTRVERFAGPVQGEMARMIDAARSAYLVRGRLGTSDIPLGEAVDRALAYTPSLNPESVTWETRRDYDGRWLVTVSWFARARTRRATWYYSPTTKTVIAADPASAALAHHDPDAPLGAVTRRTSKAPAARKRTAKKAAVKKAAPKKAAVKKAAPKKAAVKKAAPKKAAPKKAAPKKAAVKKASPKKAAVRKAAPKKAAVTKAPATKAPVTKAKKAPTSRGRALRVVPDPEPRTSRKTAAERDGVKTRASVPGWADVLLGTSPGSVGDDR